MVILPSFATPLQRPNLPYFKYSLHTNYYPPFTTIELPIRSYDQPKTFLFLSKASRSQRINTQGLQREHEEEDVDVDVDADADVTLDADDEYVDEFSPRGRFRGRGVEEEIDYDRDPEFAEILGNCLDEPQKAQSKMEERLRKKRSKILHTKTGSAIPMKVTFNKFDFLNSHIWLEFYNAPLSRDVTLICDAIRSWHIVGRLGGCNSMNMQLSQSTLDKRPTYDAIQGANVAPTTFYNIGDLEIQDNIARIWVDIGTSEPLLLDILINAFTQISSDYIGIKQLVFGGSEFENWKENSTAEDTGYSVHKI